MTKKEDYIPRGSRTLKRGATALGMAAAVLAAGFISSPPHGSHVQAMIVGDTLEAPGDAPAVDGEDEHAPKSAEGRASYYGNELAGRETASGERFDPEKMTAAHPNLPFGTRIRVTNLKNGKSAVVRVNDRGPFTGRRIIDLSYAAAREIGMIRRGTARVRIEIVE